MLRTILHRGKERGYVKLNGLDVYHSFSFGHYYDPNKMNFGALRVLNSEIISGSQEPIVHNDDNIEIITIPLNGALEYRDNIGNHSLIGVGDVQIMSAGSGIEHCDTNIIDSSGDTWLLQIWIFPNKKNVVPRYQKKSYNKDRLNEFQQIVSPDPQDAGVWIYQQAWLALGTFDKRNYVTYHLYSPKKNGVYIFVIKGRTSIGGVSLGKGDALGIVGASSIDITIDKIGTQLLMIEVPI